MAQQDMDEERFQDLIDDIYGDHWPVDSKQAQKAKLLERGMSTKDADSFMSRLAKGARFITNFGPTELRTAIENINTQSSDKELKRLRDRLYKGIDPLPLNVSISIPGHGCGDYWIEWLRGRTITPPDDEDPNENAEDETSPDGGFGIFLPSGTIMTLKVGGSSFLNMPIGTVRYPRGEVRFLVIRVLCKREYWVMYDYDMIQEDGLECSAVRPEGRSYHFPGTRTTVSLGVLPELFSGNSELQIRKEEGFRVCYARRYNGIIQAEPSM